MSSWRSHAVSVVAVLYTDDNSSFTFIDRRQLHCQHLCSIHCTTLIYYLVKIMQSPKNCQQNLLSSYKRGWRGTESAISSLKWSLLPANTSMTTAMLSDAEKLTYVSGRLKKPTSDLDHWRFAISKPAELTAVLLHVSLRDVNRSFVSEPFIFFHHSDLLYTVYTSWRTHQHVHNTLPFITSSGITESSRRRMKGWLSEYRI